MSSLAKDSAAAFKSALPRQDYSSWHSQPPPLAGSSSELSNNATAANAMPSSSQDKKKKRPKTNVVFSQPADTGTGTNINTQLVYAVNHLKSTQNPMRLQDIAIVTNTPLDSDLNLLEKFKSHDKVNWDPKTDLYSYKHDFSFRSKAALLTEIQRQSHQNAGSGLSVRALKESWKDAPAAIEELEGEGQVLVTRTIKDGQLRMVFFNEIKPTEEEGGVPVDKEFGELWHSLKVPNDVDLLRQLEDGGHQQTQAQTTTPKGANPKKKGKKAAPRQRQAKITNTHLKGIVDLSKDFVPFAKSS